MRARPSVIWHYWSVTADQPRAGRHHSPQSKTLQDLDVIMHTSLTGVDEWSKLNDSDALFAGFSDQTQDVKDNRGDFCDLDIVSFVARTMRTHFLMRSRKPVVYLLIRTPQAHPRAVLCFQLWQIRN